MHPRNVGGTVTSKASVRPQSASAGTVNGVSVDRKNFMSCLLCAFSGAASGSPSAQTVDLKLQESADGSTGWTDIAGASVTQITADDGEAKTEVDLSGAERYIRAVAEVAFTGGTSPAVPVAGVITLGGPVIAPVTH